MIKPVQTTIEHNTKLLQKASVRIHTKHVKRLIPVSNPKIGFSEALQEASKNGHIECIKLLIPVSDYKKVIKQMQKYHQDITTLQQCIDEYETLQQKERLTHILDAVSNKQNNSNKRKM